jgi:hypothetical protein
MTRWQRSCRARSVVSSVNISLAPADLKAAMLAEDMPEAIADRMLDLERYFRENHGSRVTGDVKRVTGRDPRRFADFARETAATGVWLS